MNNLNTSFMHYLGRLFLVRFLAFLAFFVIILQMLDLLNKSSDIMAADGADISSIWRYISLRAPQIASQFTPFAALLGIVVTLAGLSFTSEIIIMRAAGMSVHRILFPLGAMCAVIALAHFTFHELVTVRSSEALAYWESNEYAVDLPAKADTRTNLRMNYEGQFIRAENALRNDGVTTLRNLSIYQLDELGLTIGGFEAVRARFSNGEWELFSVDQYNALTLNHKRYDTLVWSNAPSPDLLFSLTLEPEQTSLGELAQKIEQLRAEGGEAYSAMTSLLARVAQPMATLVMPLLGALAGFGIHRQGVLLARAVLGSALGFTYFVAENLTLALGKLGILPSFVGAFFTFALFMVVGFSILLQQES